MAESTDLPTGARLRCEQCGSEVIVLKAATAELTCCEAPMVVISKR
jgi:desulfoferrodoxin-like iron-binding protein